MGDHHPKDNDSNNMHGHEFRSTLDDLFFSQEELYFQIFDLEFDSIIKEFLTGICSLNHHTLRQNLYNESTDISCYLNLHYDELDIKST